jgi:hypothetical protein
VTVSLVAASSSLPHAGEQPGFTFDVAVVWHWYRFARDERVAQRDVPRTQRGELRLEVLAAALEACRAVGHAP